MPFPSHVISTRYISTSMVKPMPWTAKASFSLGQPGRDGVARDCLCLQPQPYQGANEALFASLFPPECHSPALLTPGVGPASILGLAPQRACSLCSNDLLLPNKSAQNVVA